MHNRLCLISALCACSLAFGVTTATIDYRTYALDATPRGVLAAFHDGPGTRGFSWETDTSVATSRVWILEGEHGAADADQFLSAGTLFEGVHSAVSAPAAHCHRVAVTGLVAGKTYSYRLGAGDERDVYGTFSVRAPGDTAKILHLSDAQTKDLGLLHTWENAAARGVDQAGLDGLDFVLYTGDLYDENAPALKPNKYLQWALAVDTATPYLPGVPWSFASGNHDYTVYADATAVNRDATGGHSFDYGNLHVATLSYLGGWSNAYVQQLDWLDADLRRASNATWKVVALHWGPYTSGDHYLDVPGTKDLIRKMAPICASNHVDLVVQGHDHVFTKTLPYRWDGAGYTTSATDPDVINLMPATETRDGEIWDVDPAGTYYIECGASGHRVAENTAYADLSDSPHCYTNGLYKIATDVIDVDSPWGKKGDNASSDLAASMFGVLKVEGGRLAYDFYVVATNGTEAPVLYDTLRILKKDAELKRARANGLTWELESDAADGTVAANAVLPSREAGLEIPMNVIGATMTWKADPAPRAEFADSLSAEPTRTYTRSLWGSNNASYGRGGLVLPHAVSTLGLTESFTLECYLRIDAGSSQWSRLVQVLRANTVNQFGNGPEGSYAFVVQQASAAVEGGEVSLQVRTDTQMPATNRTEPGGGFNAGTCVQRAPVGTWVHWALTYDAGKHEIATYLNGANRQSHTLPRALQFDDVDDQLAFFERGTGGVGLVKYSPRVLAANELLANTTASLMDAPTGPVRGWWRFEGGAVTSEVNTAWWQPGVWNWNGIFATNEVYSATKRNLMDGGERIARGNVGSLYAATGFVSIPQSRAATVTNFTAECFFKDCGGSQQFITILQRTRANVTFDGATASGMSSWFVTLGSGTLRIRCDTVPETGVKPLNGTNWNQARDGKKNIKDGQWHHVALTYDDPTRTFRLYVDYELDATLQTAYPLPQVPGELLVGANNPNLNNNPPRVADYFVDEFRYTAEILPVERFLRFKADGGSQILFR